MKRPPRLPPRSGGSAICAVAFPTRLGWMGLLTRGPVVVRLTIGHRSRTTAQKAIDAELHDEAAQWASATEEEQSAALPDESAAESLCELLIARLRAYAAGEVVDFQDVAVEIGSLSRFRRRVVYHCRRIAYGRTATYGQLARLAGSPCAARAVGRVMASNRLPIIVPCHRVVAAGGSLGGFTAPGGVELKQRMLALEAAGLRKQEAH